MRKVDKDVESHLCAGVLTFIIVDQPEPHLTEDPRINFDKLSA
jgi:hypothetical protein